jgi:hypothetical protein
MRGSCGGKWRGLTRVMAVCVVAFFCAHIWAAEDFKQLIADRTAVEKVYYENRIGEKPPFEKAVPLELIEKLVRLDLKKEAVLRRVYGIEITPEMTAAEVQRIRRTTRAPKILADLQRALGGDAGRFAATVAQPIVVERELRSHFENDDRIHAPLRRAVEAIRDKLLAVKKKQASVSELWALFKQASTNAAQEVTWQLGAQPVKDRAANGIYSIEGTVQPGKVSSTTHADETRKIYFADLEPELQRVLAVQLQQAGDVSAVIETPSAFLLFLALEKNQSSLKVGSLTLQKRSYDEWLAEQPGADDSK